MRYKLLTISILIVFFTYGQKKSGFIKNENSKNIKWAEYYSVNKNYSKAIEYFMKIEDSLTPIHIRLYSDALKNLNDLKTASKIMDPLVKSNYANITDYYKYASLIPDNNKLAQEYINKANKLPLEGSNFSKIKKSNSSYNINNLNFNTEKSEFASSLIDPSSGLLFFLGNQGKITKKINSNSQIYNLFKTNINLNTFDTGPIEEFDSRFNSVYQDGPISLNPISKMLYLTRTSDRIKNNKNIQLDIFQIPFKNIGKQLPVPVEFNIDGYTTFHPSVSQDGQTLYFSSDRPGGYGGMDIYSIKINNDKAVGQVKNLGPDINTENDEVFPFSFSKNILFYSSNNNQENKFNILMASNEVFNRWKINILGEPFNSNGDDTSFSIEKKVSTGFFSSNRDEGKGDDDVYAFKFTPDIVGKEDFYFFKGTDTLIVGMKNILDNDIEKMIYEDPLIKIIPLKVRLVDNVKSGELILNQNGSFLYKSNSFKTEKDSFSYKVVSDYGTSEKINVILKNNFKYNKVFRPIYFDYNKSDIQAQFKPRLDSIVESLNNNPNLKIEISSFADCRGTEEYNLILTQERNKEIIDYIKSRIEDKNRVQGKAYGESKVEGNSGLRYTIIVGIFDDETSVNNFVNENNLEKDKIEIIRLKNYFQVILGNFSSYIDAEKSFSKIKKQFINAKITKLKCKNRSEVFHRKNRKTTFKLID